MGSGLRERVNQGGCPRPEQRQPVAAGDLASRRQGVHDTRQARRSKGSLAAAGADGPHDGQDQPAVQGSGAISVAG